VTRIGFIGLGNMGGPMVKNLLKAGYEVTGWDIAPDRTAASVKDGAVDGGNPAGCTKGAEFIISMLPNSPETEQVMYGPDGIFDVIEPGQLFIDMGSCNPVNTKIMAEKLREKGVDMLDAPVSGGVKGAVQGTLVIMVGGEEKCLAQARPVFEALGQNIVHMGDNAMGHTTKCVQQYVTASCLLALSEGLTVGAKVGLDPGKALTALQGSTAATRAGEFHFPEYVLTRKFDFGFAMRLLNKDVDIFTSVGRELGVPLFQAAVVKQFLSMTLAEEPGMDHTELVKFLERWSGVEVK